MDYIRLITKNIKYENKNYNYYYAYDNTIINHNML